MIRAARLRFMVYVTGVLTLVLFTAGALVYVLLSRQLDDAVDAELRAIAAPLAAPGGPVRLAAESEALPTGAFVVRLVGGREFARSPSTPGALPDLDAIEAARADGDDLRTIEVGGKRYRLLTRVVSGPGGRGGAVTQTGLSLAARERQQWVVRLALAGGGGLGLLLTAGGAFFLAGRALAPIEAAMTRQRRFVSDASHELRTPLALLRIEAERLDAGREERPLLRQVGRLSRLVDDLLLLTRLDEHGLRIEREAVPVDALLHTAAADARRLAPEATVSVEAPPDLWVEVDPDRLQQALLVLLDNAARVTPAGGRIALRAATAAGSVRITVTDSGPGVPREHAAHIFDRFYRVDRARSRAAGGSGLGLAIARDIVEAHGGRLTLDNPGAPGAEFSIRLPLHAVSTAHDTADGEGAPAPQLAEPGAG